MKLVMSLQSDDGTELVGGEVRGIPEDLLTRAPSRFNDNRQDAVMERVHSTFTALYWDVAAPDELKEQRGIKR